MRICAINEETTTLEEAYQLFISVKSASSISQRTLKDYETYVIRFIKESHNTTDFKVLCSDVVTYFSKIPDTSPARYNHPYEYLSSFFNFCIKQDILPKNPLTQMGLSKKRDDGNIKPAKIEDIKLLLDSYDKKTYSGFRMYAMILLMLDTGIRTNEIVNLKNSDYDGLSRQITVNKSIAKTRKSRILYLSDSTVQAINKIQKIKPKEWDDYLFPSRDGKQLQSHALTVDFNRRCNTLGIKITPYQLRHSFATYFVQSGGNIFTLQNLMGHSDIRMTKRYTDINDETKRLQHDENTPLNLLINSSKRVCNI